VEARRRQLTDWENGIIPSKPGGELNEKLDQWMEFLKVEDGEAEAERMRQVDARRKVEEARREARRAAIAAETLVQAQNPGVRIVSGPNPPQPVADMGQAPPQQYQQPQGGEMVQHQQQDYTPTPQGQEEMNGYRPNKRKRPSDRQLTRELQAQLQQQEASAYQYQLAHPPEPARRVVVEGALTKEDWRDIMGNDARLRALESKVDKIELLVTQNNKLLLQLVQNQTKERERNTEEDRVPVHLDAEFERDYLTGRYSKTPLPIN